MSKGKDIAIDEKQKITKLLTEEMPTLEKSKSSDEIKKAIENTTKLRTQSKEKGFKNVLFRDKRKLKHVKVNQPLLISAHIFEKAGTKRVKRIKWWSMLCELESV